MWLREHLESTPFTTFRVLLSLPETCHSFGSLRMAEPGPCPDRSLWVRIKYLPFGGHPMAAADLKLPTRSNSA